MHSAVPSELCKFTQLECLGNNWLPLVNKHTKGIATISMCLGKDDFPQLSSFTGVNYLSCLLRFPYPRLEMDLDLGPIS